MTAADVAREFRRPAALWRDADPNMRRLILIGFIETLSVNAYFSLIVPFAATLHLDSQAVGGLTSLLQVVSALIAVGAGVMADRSSRKAMFTAGQIIRVAITLALITTHSYSGLVIVFVLRGLATIQSPAQQAITANLTRRDNRATMLALSQTLGQLASVLMPLASGAIADAYGAKWSFAVGCVLAIVAVVMGIGLKDGSPAAVSAEQTAVRATDVARHEPLAARIRRMFAGRQGVVLGFLLAAGVFNGLANGAVNIILPFTVMDRFSSGYTVVASVSSVMSFGTMLVLLIGGRMADLGGRRKMVIASGIIFPLTILPIFFINSLWQLALILIVTSMVGNISSPAIGAVFMEAVGDRDRATFAGLQMSLGAAGMALGSVLAGVGYKLSPDWSWGVVIFIWFLQVVCYHFVLPRDDRRASAVAAPAED